MVEFNVVDRDVPVELRRKRFWVTLLCCLFVVLVFVVPLWFLLGS